MLKLSKINCLLAGFTLLLLIYSIDRLRYLVGAEIVTGTFVFYIDEVVKEEKLTFPIIEYTIKDSTFQFRAKENTVYELNQTVPVLLENGNPDTPLLFTIGSFWLYPLFYFILPVLLLVAFVMSYVGKDELIGIGLKPPFLKRIKKVS